MEEGHTRERLKELRALPLERKVGFTAARIAEWYEHYNGKVYVSFSGGKDSTVLLHIARKLYPDIKAVYVDTGLEYPEIKEFVKSFDNVDIIRPKLTFREVLDTYGYPVVSKEVAKCVQMARADIKSRGAASLGFTDEVGYNITEGGVFDQRKYQYLYHAPFKISDKCCTVMKKQPANEYNKKTGLFPIIATMTEESLLRERVWLRSGCNAFNAKHPKSAPMSFWTEQDVLHYIRLKNIRIASVYGAVVQNKNGLVCTGCNRTGCVFCLFGIQRDKRPNRIQRLSETHPKLYDYCLNQLGLKDVMEYLGEPYVLEHGVGNCGLASILDLN